MKTPHAKIEKQTAEHLKAVATVNPAAAVAPKVDKTALKNDKARNKLTAEQLDEELKALEQAEAEQVAEAAGEPVQLAQAAEAAATDAAATTAVAGEATTSGLVGGAAVAGGLGGGAVAGGALLGAAALSNGGGDGSAAPARTLSAFNVESSDESFSQQNVIADVVNIQATSVFVGTIAAGVSSTTSSELGSEGSVEETVSEVVAAQSVDITATGETEFAMPVPALPVAQLRAFDGPTGGIFVGNYNEGSTGGVDSSGIHAQNVTLTAEGQSVGFSQITGGGRLIETSSAPAEGEEGVVSDVFDLSVNAANTVEITAAHVYAFSGFDSFRGEFIPTPNVAANQVNIEADEVNGLNIGGDYVVKYSYSDNIPESFEYSTSNATSVDAASDVTIVAAEYVDRIQAITDSLTVNDGATGDSASALDIGFIAASGALSVSYSESTTLVDEDESTVSYEYEQQTVYSVEGASNVEIDADSVAELLFVADNVNVTANQLGSINVTGGVSALESSVDAYDYEVDGPLISGVDKTKNTFSVTAASEVTIDITAAPVMAQTSDEMGDQEFSTAVWSSPSTGLGLAAEVVSVTTTGTLFGSSNEFGLIGGDFYNPYSISGSYSAMETSERIYGDEEEPSFTSNATITFEAAKSVTLMADGSIGEIAIAAEVFTATANQFGGLSVDGGRTSAFDNTKSLSDEIVAAKIGSDESDDVVAADMVTINATGDANSFIDVFALSGSVTTIGATDGSGDVLRLFNAEGEDQTLTIDLGQGYDYVNFGGYDYAAIDLDASGFDEETDVLTLVFNDGDATDTFTISNVDSFSFDVGSFDLAGLLNYIQGETLLT